MVVPYPPSRDLLLDIPPMPRALIGAGLHAQVGIEEGDGDAAHAGRDAWPCGSTGFA